MDTNFHVRLNSATAEIGFPDRFCFHITNALIVRGASSIARGAVDAFTMEFTVQPAMDSGTVDAAVQEGREAFRQEYAGRYP